ncbi:hypothetical protein FJ366_01630 [Candidatus Dependentiae bacterium]|nr:hypothetical protein [Candidatus Dependentiae bacterium]
MNKVFMFLVSTFFAVLASIVLLYISISSGIGPWISPVIVLSTAALMRLFGIFSENVGQNLAGIQALGASTGLIASAVAFTFPAYFFIDSTHFTTILQARTFVGIGPVVIFIFTWGMVGLLIGHFFAQSLLKDSALKVPVAELVKTTISASHEKEEFSFLLRGGVLGAALCLIRKLANILASARVVPSIVQGGATLFSGLITPTIWAVGFIAGKTMAIGLLVGICLKYCLFKPVHYFYFAHQVHAISLEQYFVAVSSGLVLTDLLFGGGQFVVTAIKKINSFLSSEREPAESENFLSFIKKISCTVRVEYFFLASLFAIAGLWPYGIKDPFLILFLFGAVLVAVYQMTLMAGQIGLVQFGRFATFVMLPALVFFRVSAFHAVLVSAAVSISGAVAGSMLFQYRLADELKMKRSTMYWIHVAAICLASIFVVAGFFILCSHLQLGSAEFFGFRGYARALLIKSFDFDLLSLVFGLMVGIVLRFCKMSPSMVLGGLLMPKELVFAFLFGAGINQVLGKDKKYMPIASGVFAAEAIWIFLSILHSFC